ncbi:MAG TPA: hypothetical protein VEL03_15315 [Streptosporangiaceae bacterium]|nr:hypothetical protein [Streptosporangiaceae bacterium]
MTNFNDAEITDLYVGPTSSPGVQDDAPNAPATGGAGLKNYDVTLEMVAGGGLNGPYTLHITCSNVSDTTPAPAAMVPIPGPLNGLHDFEKPPWDNPAPGLWTFHHHETIKIPAGAAHKVYQYTAALVNSNNQVVSIKQSDPFILV